MQAISIGLARLCRIFQPEHWDDDLADLYVEALDDLDPELMMLATRRCIKFCEFFPRPAEIRKLISDELKERAEATNRRLRERAMLPAPAPEKNGWEAATPEERAAQQARLDELKRALGGPTHERRRPLPPHCERNDLRPLRPIGELLAGFRFPDADDPRVLSAMRASAEDAE
jgi:hypothetical protein